jgi:para-nitrobenzyl esterase
VKFNSRPGRAAALGALCVSVIALALHPIAGHAAAFSHLNEVRTQSGLVLGTSDEDVVAFKGIAYAAPPVGDLRWRAPRPPAPWSGTFTADRYGAICTQKYLPKDNGVGALPMSEDCLTLNVWRPMNEGSGRLPVMVWIHGGGFVDGSGTAALYDGSALSRQGVVVVTLNYRLGRFGFFAHPALTREDPKAPLGNYGLLDQIAALKWVKANIAGFGGDPNQVTIFGESAGGMSVNQLMVSPAARGLFERAIVESGVGGEYSVRLDETNPMGVPSAEAAGAAFAKSLGVDSADPAALRAIPADKIIAAGNPTPLGGSGPIIDGQVVTMDVSEAFAKGLEAKVPYIVGSNSLEFPIPVAGVEKMLGDVTHLTPDQRARIEAAYGDKDAFTTNIISDAIFTAPARRLAALHAKNGQPTWLYRFSVLSPSVRGVLKGAVHASERQYVFQTLNASPWPTGEQDKAAATAMSAYWTHFAKAGDPNGGGLPAWPAYSAREDRLLDFTNDGPVAEKVPHTERLDAIIATAAAGR